ncbi:isopentenyl-diphosphate Delta-isomerase [Cardinium endosymbiont of Philonthus spinipes]|uniref:isopentenyl-diphosphate Delta-isomerase n=1 Tax=Cardinium endosymbiont of Philonthus spinipes TaxID=3077941 RepID=UPI00313AC85D
MLESKHVVLVDHKDNILGIQNKLEAHHAHTPLHRGVCVFLFDHNKRLLLQRRSSLKKTWPLFWSNSFCGHPQITETYEQAVHRHSQFELGISLQALYHVADYCYQCTMKGSNIMEYEICPIYIAQSDETITINKAEIEEVRLLEWSESINFLNAHLANFTPWCIEAFDIVKSSKLLQKIIEI